MPVESSSGATIDPGARDPEAKTMSFDPEFNAPDPKKAPMEPVQFGPEPPPRKGLGCLGWGCIISVVLAVLLLIGIGLTAYLGYRWVVNTAIEYTDPQPRPIPPLVLNEEEAAAVSERWDTFKQETDAGHGSTISLNTDELNALLRRDPNMRDKVVVKLEDDRIRGDISIPLASMGIDLPALKGRYINGSATFKVTEVNGRLDVRIEALEVRGKPVPQEFMGELKTKNLADEASDDPEVANALESIESVEVKDGMLTIVTRKSEKKSEGEAAGEPSPAAEGDGESAAEAPAAEAVPAEEPKEAESPAPAEAPSEPAPATEPAEPAEPARPTEPGLSVFGVARDAMRAA